MTGRAVTCLSALALLLVPACESLSSKPQFTITFHAEAEEMDPRKTMFPVQLHGRPTMFFKIVPELSHLNVVAFHPFDSDSGDHGVALQLDFRGRGSLEMATRMRRGEFLLAMVNGKPVDCMVLDEVIDSGLITVWQGITPEIIKAMDKKYTRIKPGGATSINESMEMLPATKKEKKRALEEARSAEKAAEKARKSGKPETSDILRLDAPRAPVSSSIPVEGGESIPAAPSKATPAVEPPLPKP